MTKKSKVATIEEQAASTISEDQTTLNIGGKTYRVAQPSLATIISVSEVISTMPTPEISEDRATINWVLSNAKDYKAIGDILAILIIGAKKARRSNSSLLRRLLGRNAVKKLSREIIENADAGAIALAIAQLMGYAKFADFFALTVSLFDLNVLKTEEAGKTTTAPGRSS